MGGGTNPGGGAYSNPAMAMVEVRVDGAAIPIAQLRGKGEKSDGLDFADWGLGSLSGHAIGTIARVNRTLTQLNLKHNALGADGAAAVVEGLGETPLTNLDLTRNSIGGDSNGEQAILKLSNAICQRPVRRDGRCSFTRRHVIDLTAESFQSASNHSEILRARRVYNEHTRHHRFCLSSNSNATYSRCRTPIPAATGTQSVARLRDAGRSDAGERTSARAAPGCVHAGAGRVVRARAHAYGIRP